MIQVSVFLGLIIASPVWLYQLWAFIVPGLHKKERRLALSFVAAAVPLFLGGVLLAWLVLPNAVRVLTDFTPSGGSNFISAQVCPLSCGCCSPSASPSCCRWSCSA